ncbi:hypothetical protein B0H15DRAFT_837057 [Mycena belliarum]|uniref:FAD-binding domain-containing protein n=1 Tax=Mycena belliarum TaxID=1033014 RepID=A0AAD6U9V6_9AGAR|nr:hypothetical protein B0H15DRAFT_837057 [Mycena belliae]
MSPPPHDATRFIVVGGSIAGLCVAYTLRQARHHVVVLDKRDERVESHAGIRVPPNMTRLLETLPGMAALLKEHGTECNGMTMMEETSNIIAQMPFLDETMADLGCKFYMMPYDILINYLLDLCRESGVHLRFNTEVTSVIVAPGQWPAVVTIRGERIEGDLLIGADGRASLVQETLAQQQQDDEDDDSDTESTISEKDSSAGVSEIVGASYSIKLSALQNDPELSQLARSHEFMVWGGPHVLVTGHKCGRELYIVSVLRVSGTGPADIDSDWRPNAPFPDAKLFSQFEPRIKRLIKAASVCHQTIQRIPDVRRITHGPTRLVTIGDAAHTITMHATHNSSIAVEDGFALGRVFSHLTAREQIPYLLRGYREVRLQRSMTTEASELGAFIVITLPHGPARDMRNQQFGFSLGGPDDMSDEMLAMTWATYLVQFNYDANEAVDEWWLMAKFNMQHYTNTNGNGRSDLH